MTGVSVVHRNNELKVIVVWKSACFIKIFKSIGKVFYMYTKIYTCCSLHLEMNQQQLQLTTV